MGENLFDNAGLFWQTHFKLWGNIIILYVKNNGSFLAQSTYSITNDENHSKTNKEIEWFAERSLASSRTCGTSKVKITFSLISRFNFEYFYSRVHSLFTKTMDSRLEQKTISQNDGLLLSEVSFYMSNIRKLPGMAGIEWN